MNKSRPIRPSNYRINYTKRLSTNRWPQAMNGGARTWAWTVVSDDKREHPNETADEKPESSIPNEQRPRLCIAARVDGSVKLSRTALSDVGIVAA